MLLLSQKSSFKNAEFTQKSSFVIAYLSQKSRKQSSNTKFASFLALVVAKMLNLRLENLKNEN